MLGWTLTATGPDGMDRTIHVMLLEDGTSVDVRIAGTQRAWVIEDLNEIAYVWGELLKAEYRAETDREERGLHD